MAQGDKTAVMLGALKFSGLAPSWGAVRCFLDKGAGETTVASSSEELDGSARGPGAQTC